MAFRLECDLTVQPSAGRDLRLFTADLVRELLQRGASTPDITGSERSQHLKVSVFCIDPDEDAARSTGIELVCDALFGIGAQPVEWPEPLNGHKLAGGPYWEVSCSKAEVRPAIAGRAFF